MASRGACDLSADFRIAIYYAPELDDPLWSAGCEWLGRDPERGAAIAQPALESIEVVTAAARGYGFHCTLKPPMRLSTSYGDFLDAAVDIARSVKPFDLPRLAVADLSGFLALQEVAPSAALQALADICVAWPDNHRAAPTCAELQRRRANGLAPDADRLLQRWGYPDVFARWRFHMTLTHRLTPDLSARWRSAATGHFASALARTRKVTSICLFTQSAPGAAFLLAERIPLG